MTGEKFLLVRRLTIKNTLKPSHLISSHFKDKKKASNLNVSQEEADDDENYPQKDDAESGAGNGGSQDNELIKEGLKPLEQTISTESITGLDAQIVGLKLLQMAESLQSSPNLCQIVDCSEYTVLSPEAWQVYIISESYNYSLSSVYMARKGEDAQFTEDELIEVAYQVL